MSSYRIVIADLDGTLLNQQHTISSFTRKVIQQLIDQGLFFILATGRHFIDVQSIQKNLGVNGFVITANGARIHDDQGNILFKKDIPVTIAHRLLQLISPRQGVITSAYHENGWLINASFKEYQQFHPDSNFCCNPFPDELDKIPSLSKIFYLGPIDMLTNIAETIKKIFSRDVNLAFSNLHCLEVMARNVSKGVALQTLLTHPMFSSNKFTLKNCIAFGDGMNDIEMLSVVGKGCIMANASPQLKNQLPHLEVIGDNTSEALAHYLKKLFI